MRGSSTVRRAQMTVRPPPPPPRRDAQYYSLIFLETTRRRNAASVCVLLLLLSLKSLLLLLLCGASSKTTTAMAMATLGKEKEDAFLSELKSRLRVEEITPHVEALSHFSTTTTTTTTTTNTGSKRRRGGGVTRLVYTDDDARAREYVKMLMQKNGLTVREDAMGTIFGRLEGTETVKKRGTKRGNVVGSGSHTDAIPLSGKYDGVYGVLGAVEALGALKRAKFQPRRHLEAVMFNSEEPSRFGMACSGSRAMGGVLDAEKLQTLPDVLNTSKSFFDAATQAGYGSEWRGENGSRARTAKEMVEKCSLMPMDSHYYSFVELHIEQGPELEHEKLDIGVVTAIAAPAAMEITFEGDGGHAGAQLMHLRNDAVVAGSKLAVAVEKFAKQSGSRDTVATVGGFTVKPNAINSVPRSAVLEIDVRDIDLKRRDHVVQQIKNAAKEIASEQNVRVDVRIINKDDPATSGDSAMNAVELAVTHLGHSMKRMVSRAYHDTLFVAKACSNVGMIFIPCYKGYSHRPDEFSTEEQMRKGVETLALTMAKLSRESSSIDDVDEEHAKLPFFVPDRDDGEGEGERSGERGSDHPRDPSMEERRGPNDEL